MLMLFNCVDTGVEALRCLLRNRRSVAVLVLLFVAVMQATKAQVFLAHPKADKGEEVWFRSGFRVEHVPDSALLDISTAGYALVYVNGRVAFPETIWPYRADSPSSLIPCRLGIATRRIDIKPLLRYGRNVLAVWYAPCRLDDARLLPQIAAVLTMKNGMKSDVVVDEDSEWRCRIATSKKTVYGEDDNAEAYYPDWKREDRLYDRSWMAPEKIWTENASWSRLEDNSLVACNTVRAKANVKTDSTQVFYTPTVVTGQLKVTLRGARSGQELLINGMRYRCNGTADEQFITRFATVTTDCIEIRNISGRKFPDVQSVEIVELTPFNKNSKYGQYH